METDTTLLLDLDERNLAHFLSGLALAALAQRVEGTDIKSRRAWWPEKPGQFAIRAELPQAEFRLLLFTRANDFLKAMQWRPGLGGVQQGIIISGDEMGLNPFVPLGGDSERPLLRAFSAKVIPEKVLPDQIKELKSPTECSAWLGQISVGLGRVVKKGVSSWGYDCKVNMHASDAGISSDAEGTGHLDPIFPAIELLSLAGASFFSASHAWTADNVALSVTAWTEPLPLDMVSFAASGRLHGLPSRKLAFMSRAGAHGKGGSFRFFPPATLQTSTV